MQSNRCESCINLPNCLFSPLSQDEIHDLSPWRTSSQAPKGTTIYCEGQPSEGIYVLCSGTVKLLTLTRTGMQPNVGLLKGGEIFGLDALLPGNKRVFTAIAREGSELFFLDRASFSRLLRSRPELLWRLSTVLVSALQETQQTISSVGIVFATG